VFPIVFGELRLSASREGEVTMIGRIRFYAAVVVVLAIASIPLMAHHGISAAYDVCKTVTLDGVLTRLEWRNPHVVLRLSVLGKDGKTLMWNIETPAPNVLNREGLNDFFTKTGDHIIAHVFVAKDGSRDAVTQELILPDGRTISAIMGASGLRGAKALCPSQSRP
jgi:hypothetical protein